MDDLRDEGYLPTALCNFVAFLGWQPPEGREIFANVNELAQVFDLDQVSKAPGAVSCLRCCLRPFNPGLYVTIAACVLMSLLTLFAIQVDMRKLAWINRRHLREVKECAEKLSVVLPLVSEAAQRLHAGDCEDPCLLEDGYIQKVLIACCETVDKAADVASENPYFWTTPDLVSCGLLQKLAKVREGQAASAPSVPLTLRCVRHIVLTSNPCATARPTALDTVSGKCSATRTHQSGRDHRICHRVGRGVGQGPCLRGS